MVFMVSLFYNQIFNNDREFLLHIFYQTYFHYIMCKLLIYFELNILMNVKKIDDNIDISWLLLFIFLTLCFCALHETNDGHLLDYYRLLKLCKLICECLHDAV